MTEARGQWAARAPGHPTGAAESGVRRCRRLGGDQLVADDEDVVVVSSSHRSASMGRRQTRRNRYPAEPLRQACVVERHDEGALIVYTDGSMLPRPRRGGYSFVLLDVDQDGEEILHKYAPPGVLGATNNEMELKACVEALRLIASNRCPVGKDRFDKIVLYTDSLYVYNGIGSAERVWPQRGWLTVENEPVLSPELWRELIRLRRRLSRVEIRKVKGHAKDPYNELADDLAKRSAMTAPRGRTAGRMVGRKRSAQKSKPRVVAMRGQTEQIRIIVVRGISGQPHHQYKYEVIGESSPDHGSVDDVFAMNETAAMRRAHCYEVRFSESGKGRWVEEVIRELDRN